MNVADLQPPCEHTRVDPSLRIEGRPGACALAAERLDWLGGRHMLAASTDTAHAIEGQVFDTDGVKRRQRRSNILIGQNIDYRNAEWN